MVDGTRTTDANGDSGVPCTPMSTRAPGLFVMVATVALLAVACASDEAPSASPGEWTTVDGPTSEVPACDGEDGAGIEHPDWPVGGGPDPAFLPVVQSSLVTIGPNRFLYNVLDSAYRQVAAPELASSVDFYAIERDPDTPAASVAAAYLSSGLGRGLYRAAVDFDCIGEWGAEISMDLADGSTVSERIRFGVHAAGSTPAIGAPAPRSDSPTAGTLDEVRLISTDAHPYPAAYEQTIGEAVSSGQPALVFFATPAFCQTGYCGPTVELVKGVAREHEDEVAFVNVEPYELDVTENGLQPRLDENGQLRPVPAALEYGIPVEPYLFVVDDDGNVFAKFEGIVGGDELRAAIGDVLAEAA